ncbi:putative UDP-glucose 4-epimerase [Magnetospirillum gryphiswaldense MSR-1 v2]|uniref:UDP-glucose 4-epimerase n=1 Tax=Magnetospirillum gryphiswaldense (strain DSM 6361 / JCM 21280 / NBRC 15271 / MSR-1) TaxID=431944 RepID=V6F5G5_MAGGM|nr:GDP-mannose 4,6-dehydratase [Magnetospirillum gryphiswaldense]CDL00617.1 putative UDP-glucose 4-epimerase [Magnetospirillum gryphiswaldense MSR-1 v2]
MAGRFAGKRVVVTGGAGFIGSHLVDALLAENAAHVAVVDSFFLGKEENLDQACRLHGDRLTVLREDAGELTAMAAVMDKVKPDLVFNLATKALLYSFFNPAGACRVNLDIAIALAELQRQGAFGRLVHFSSSEVYGTAQYVPMDENHPLLAETSYAAGKAAGDLLLSSYVKMFGADITMIRSFNNYGPRQNDGQLAAIIPLTLRKIREGGQPMIQGDGLQTRDFIYVGDTVEATLKLSQHDDIKGRVLNLGSGCETTIKAIVDGICAEVGYQGGIDWQPSRVADVRRHCGDVKAATALIGPIATTSLEQGLKQTIAWYRSHAS